MDRWRLVLHARHPAAYNMAVDEAIFCASVRGEAPPTLRLYEWSEPAISLGYFQDLAKSSIDLDYCREAGVELVRRPTGGRAVLHGHDLTFSICVSTNLVPEEFAGVLGSHLWLMRGVAAGLSRLGINAEIGDHSRGKAGDSRGAVCFDHVAECDISSLGGEKLAGAAQLRRSGVLLEQGSIPVAQPSVSCSELFRSRTKHESCLVGIPMEAARSALIEGFADALGVTFDIWDLTEREKIEADELLHSRYVSADWTAGKTCIDNGMFSCYTKLASLRGVSDHAEENSGR